MDLGVEYLVCMKKIIPVDVVPTPEAKKAPAPRKKHPKKKVEKKMSNKIYHWTSTFKSLGETDDGGVDIKGSASTNGLIELEILSKSDAWTKGGLENFKNNPIILVQS